MLAFGFFGVHTMCGYYCLVLRASHLAKIFPVLQSAVSTMALCRPSQGDKRPNNGSYNIVTFTPAAPERQALVLLVDQHRLRDDYKSTHRQERN